MDIILDRTSSFSILSKTDEKSEEIKVIEREKIKKKIKIKLILLTDVKALTSGKTRELWR